ncbi:Retrovirus-related Pol polyprotein from transposon opus [Vitis vinifera]|uniref:RNA-directed DNA polymerase n=1 Tax=Vitis vinifera TaxID=29760 RepID=A0A438HJJ9_VITVI|nr:Retrovirus-related Pol polyprotein from transposon opus [Vitis vinifera]
MDFLSYVAEVSRDGMNQQRRSGKDEVSTDALMLRLGCTLNEDDDMKAKFAAMTRRLEELELKKMHEVQVVAEHQCKSHVLFVNLMNTCPITMLYGNTYNSSWRNHPNFSWKPRAPQYQQPAQPSQQSSSLEQAIVNLSKVVGDFVGDQKPSMLNSVKELTVAKKGRFPSQPHQNPKGIHEVETHEGESSQVRDVKALITLRSVKVNIPLLDMIKTSSNICKIPKELCTIKRGLNVNKKDFLTEQERVVEKALLDLVASVNLLPYSVYKQLGLGELKPTSITLSLADRSVKIPRGIIEDVLVQVDNFYYPVDFVVLDTDPMVNEANSVPIILGRSFLATSNAIINCRNGLMQLTFGNMTLELNIFYMSKKQITPEDEEGPEEVCIIDTLVEEHCNQNMQDKLNESLADLKEGLPESSDVLATLQGWKRREEILPLLNKEDEQEAAEEETPKLNLKPLPMELKYTYLEENKQCPVVISSSLTSHQEKCLLEVLKRCKKAIGWQISDFKGISPCPWVSPTQVVPKKSGITVVKNEKGEEITTRLTSGTPDIFKLKLMLKIRRRPLSHVHLEHIPTEECLLVYAMHLQHSKDGGTFEECLDNLEAVLNRCIEKDLVLNWEKCHFMVRQGIVLGHIISKKGIEVDKAKVELIVKLLAPTTVKGMSKSFDQLKQFLTTTLIVRAPNWQLPFEVMCDASDFAIGVVLGQREDGKPYVIYYASKTLNEAQRNYTTTEKELLAVVFALDKFCAYLVGSFIIVFIDHSALKYLLTKQDAKARLIRWILLLQEFDLQIRDKKGVGECGS